MTKRKENRALTRSKVYVNANNNFWSQSTTTALNLGKLYPDLAKKIVELINNNPEKPQDLAMKDTDFRDLQAIMNHKLPNFISASKDGYISCGIWLQQKKWYFVWIFDESRLESAQAALEENIKAYNVKTRGHNNIPKGEPDFGQPASFDGNNINHG